MSPCNNITGSPQAQSSAINSQHHPASGSQSATWWTLALTHPERGGRLKVIFEIKKQICVVLELELIVVEAAVFLGESAAAALDSLCG